MALFEYFCNLCSLRFEQITSGSDPDAGKCPKCQKKETKKLISRFAVGGRGDLRESTMHGCHGCHSGHNHGHGHSSAPESEPAAASTPSDGPSSQE